MTTLALAFGDRSAPQNLVAECFRREPLFAATGMLMLALMAPTLFAMAVDQRTLADLNVWVKPLKFQAALAVYFLTLAFYAGFLPAGTTGRRWYRIFSGAVVAATAAEMVWLMGAAANGVASHFNQTNAFMAMAYPIMGGLAVLLTSAALVLGVLIGRGRDAALPPAMRQSLALGLVLTFVLTVVAAGTMSSMGSHAVGGNTSDLEALPVTGWARDGGDLRVAHFFATHAMHFIPAFALIGFRRGEGVTAVRLFSSGYAAFVAWCLAEALLGRPFGSLIA